MIAIRQYQGICLTAVVHIEVADQLWRHTRSSVHNLFVELNPQPINFREGTELHIINAEALWLFMDNVMIAKRQFFNYSTPNKIIISDLSSLTVFFVSCHQDSNRACDRTAKSM
jgi:hypothetical protein